MTAITLEENEGIILVLDDDVYLTKHFTPNVLVLCDYGYGTASKTILHKVQLSDRGSLALW